MGSGFVAGVFAGVAAGFSGVAGAGAGLSGVVGGGAGRHSRRPISVSIGSSR